MSGTGQTSRPPGVEEELPDSVWSRLLLHSSFARVVAAGLVLFLMYAGLSFLNDPGGTLSTDVGGKTATLAAMVQGGSTSPDLGYWAAEWDPTGSMHGLYYTSEVDGQYINVTTVPIMELARPLFAWGGYRAALMWSMLGAVAAAFAARSLATRTGAGESRAWAAYWLAGLASPVLLYALDLWEHAPGLALMAWAVVALVDVTAGRTRQFALTLAAGAAFGAAFSMRTEAVAYGFVVVGIACLLVWRRQSFLRAVGVGVSAGLGFFALAVVNTMLESAVIGSSVRSGRASGTATAGGSDMAIRLREAVTTTVGLFPDTATNALLFGGAAAGLLGWAVWRVSRPGGGSLARVAFAGAVLIYFIRAIDGLGFVPGFAVAAPFAIAGVVLAFDHRIDPRGRDAVLMAVGALPVVWAFQYSGGAVPQWGGRYVLTSGLVLSAVGIGASHLVDRWLQFALAGLSIAVAVFGLAWMSYRTHEVTRAAETIRAIDVPLVSVQDFWLREVGSVYRPDSEWLSVTGLGELPEAVSVLDDAGEQRFDLLWVPGDRGAAAPTIDGWAATGEDRTEDWLGVDWRLIGYERTG